MCLNEEKLVFRNRGHNFFGKSQKQSGKQNSEPGLFFALKNQDSPIGLDVNIIRIKQNVLINFYDEECLSYYHPSDVFNIHYIPVQH